MHSDELGYFIQRRADPVIAQIERIVDLRPADIDVHPFNVMVGRIVDAVRRAHAVGSAPGAFQLRRAAIDGKLGGVIEDDEHFLTMVMEMLAYARMGMNHTA